MASELRGRLNEQELDELMAQVVAGDTVAFDRLYSELYRFVVAVCAKEGGGADAEDLAQITWLKVLNAKESYGGGGKLRPWIARIAKNTTIDEHRRRGRANEGSLDEMMAPPEGAGYEPPDTDISTEDQAVSATLNDVIDEAFEQLNERQAEVMRLLVLENMRYDEIVAVTGLPVGTVKSTISRAREKMGRFLRERGVEWP